MSVKCLTKAQKDLLVFWYANKIYNIKELAERVQVSPRTINRVLIEYGLATTEQRIKGEAHQVMQLLKKHKLNYYTLRQLLESTNNVFA